MSGLFKILGIGCFFVAVLFLEVYADESSSISIGQKIKDYALQAVLPATFCFIMAKLFAEKAKRQEAEWESKVQIEKSRLKQQIRDVKRRTKDMRVTRLKREQEDYKNSDNVLE
ncbi:hypothetical protein SAMN04487969_1239 [Paenibacillus algorifonticola]|uniref:Uncharacterized protein n=1 Tax=Paenibacillus algorifonticola TaxID=684063 RepID=A0A1I2HIE4_9BACL|nr:hypothetical protein [Paenibacillus algorifonticola]SFF28546.1 hypothetical protein SAMN04487969_1239 [Paenibacillus algorifonticola]